MGVLLLPVVHGHSYLDGERFARLWLGVDRFTSLPVLVYILNNEEILLVSSQNMKRLSNLKTPNDALVVWVIIYNNLLISEMACRKPDFWCGGWDAVEVEV